MSQLLDKLSPGAFSAAAAKTFARFYLPLGCAVIWAGVSIFGKQLSGNLPDRLEILFLLGFFLLLAAKLFAERRGWGTAPYLVLSAAAFAALALKVFAAPEVGDEWMRPVVLFLGPAMVGLVMVAAFPPTRDENEALWRFNYVSWFSAAFGCLVATILGTGLSVALALIDTLLTNDFFSDAYSYIWIVCLAVVWPWQTLAGAPVEFATPEGDYCPRWLALITSWLIVPLAVLYLAIIHVYAVKILVEWRLPEGEIGWMVIGYASFGVGTHLLAWPLRESGNLLSRLFCRHFYHALVVPVVLLAIGVWVRIDNYGITEARYALVLLGLWLIGIGAYFTFHKKPRLVVAPLSIAVMLLAASFGPWGAESISMRSQMGQLQALLAKHGILADGRIVKAEQDIDLADNKRIGSVVTYLRESGKLAAIEPWFEGSDLDLANDPGGADILAAMGLPFIGEWQDAITFSYSAMRENRVSVSGFDVYAYVNVADAMDRPILIEHGDETYRVTFDRQNGTATITGPGDDSLRFEIAPVVQQLRGQGVDYYEDVDGRIMTLEAESGAMRVKLFIESVYGEIVDGRPHITSLDAAILLGRD